MTTSRYRREHNQLSATDAWAVAPLSVIELACALYSQIAPPFKPAHHNKYFAPSAPSHSEQYFRFVVVVAGSRIAGVRT